MQQVANRVRILDAFDAEHVIITSERNTKGRVS